MTPLPGTPSETDLWFQSLFLTLEMSSSVQGGGQQGSADADDYVHGTDGHRPDVMEDLNRPLAGWPELAHLMMKIPDFELFQAFTDLNIKSLLLYQAQLDELRRELHKLEWHDYYSDAFEGSREYSQRLDFLRFGGDLEDERARRQWQLMSEIRSVLGEHSECKCFGRFCTTEVSMKGASQITGLISKQYHNHTIKLTDFVA
jgi:hypothetical protein